MKLFCYFFDNLLLLTSFFRKSLLFLKKYIKFLTVFVFIHTKRLKNFKNMLH